MMRRISLLLFSLLTYLLLATGTTLADPSNTPDPHPTSSSDDIAYIDLALTTTDEHGGEISVDEAFSLHFRSDATEGWDGYDASKLLPRGDTWAAMAFKGTKDGEDVLKAQESRPYSDSVQVVDIELIQKNMPAATYTLSVQQWYSVPDDWTLKLRSEALDETFIIEDADDTVTFELEASTSKRNDESVPSPKSTSDTTHLSMSGEVGPPSSSLPVELSSFAATLDGERATLEWETLSETNNSGFAVQHRPAESSSSDRWSRLGFVTGEGTTDEPQSYRFSTSTLDPGIHEFRLKQIDRDGTAHLTEVEQVERAMEKTVDLTTAPNPFAERLTVSITARSSQTVTIQLVDMLGRVVKEKGPLSVSAHSPTRMHFAGQRLSSGNYLLRVNGDTFTETQQVAHVR